MSTTTFYTPPKFGEPIEVHSLSADDVTPELGREVLQLRADAYSAQLGPQYNIPEKFFRLEYLGATQAEHISKVESLTDTIYERLKTGGSCSVVYDYDNKLSSLAMVTALENDSGFYINDILTKPGRQRQGLGSCVTHAALSTFDAPDDTKLSLESFAESEINSWYGDLTFDVPLSTFKRRTIRIGGYALYLIPHSSTLGSVRDALEESTGKPQTASPTDK